ncbi:hypothetical protein E6C60_1161 [Paenibacillus algicola]|uniref:Uncharacterized protein n=1 Tax=Paenibacillus algicola TaxID=2565926 RepID=A0A4P8XNI9_9BACL|nr:hypothetical protein E6C60_1161 [Paenibacillus algicola]
MLLTEKMRASISFHDILIETLQIMSIAVFYRCFIYIEKD